MSQDISVKELTGKQLAEYEYEVYQFQKLCKSQEMAEVDYCNLGSVINALTFEKLCQEVQKQCPLLTQILQAFVQHEEKRKIKTAAEKLLRVIHMNACLLRIGSQTSSSFPHYFGILLVSFGCGQGEKLIFNLFYSLTFLILLAICLIMS